MKTSITITAVWLRRIGDRVQVLVEGERGWVLAIEEHAEAAFSHIAEGNGAYRWPLDPNAGGWTQEPALLREQL